MFMPKYVIQIGLSGCLMLSAVAVWAEAGRETAPQIEVVGANDEPLPPSPMIDDREAVKSDLRIGSLPTAEEIAAIDIDIMPDGSGLPAGRGTFDEGKVLYEERCAACHGDNLEGVADVGAPTLIGGADSLTTDTPLKTVESYWPYASTLFDYIRRTMPLPEPGSLTNDEVYAISAYILGRAGIVSEDVTLDAAAFKEIGMPNEGNFIPDPRPETH